MMRKALILPLSTLLALGALVGVALAASGLAGRTYAGTGQEYQNNGTHLQTHKGFREHMSFHVSTTGTHVKGFKGYYEYYCGTGVSSVIAKSLKISSAGRFGGTGTKAAYSNGVRTGTLYLHLRGRFIDAGKKAAVTYQATFVALNQTDPHPYSFAYQSPTRACQNKVTGTIKVK